MGNSIILMSLFFPNNKLLIHLSLFIPKIGVERLPYFLHRIEFFAKEIVLTTTTVQRVPEEKDEKNCTKINLKRSYTTDADRS